MSNDDLIFITYAGPDRKKAEALAVELERLGHRVFVDSRALKPGDVWGSAIVDTLNRASMIVVLVSAAWRTGDRWYAHDEVARAVARAGGSGGVRLVPAIIGAISALHMPSGLAQLVPLRGIDGDWAASARVLSGIAKGTAEGHQPGDRRDRGVRVSLGRLPGGGLEFVGRRAELTALDAAWQEPGVRLQTVIGVGGEGKTALVRRWLDRMAADQFRGAARVYDWSFYTQVVGEDWQTLAARFVEQLLVWLDDPRPYEGDPRAKGLRLAGLIREQPTLLVLDGLEPLQFPPGEGGGLIKDLALATLLGELRGYMDGLCVITSRVPVRDVMPAGPGVKAMSLPRLSADVGAQVLGRWHVHGSWDELRAAVEDVQGHALALNLMGSYLRMYCGGDVRRRGEIEQLTEAEDGGGHATRVMAAYDRWLGEDDRRVLRIVGLFDRAADEAAVSALLAEPAIAGLTDGLTGGVTGRRWLRAAAHLRGLGLLVCESGVDAHPLVREAFGAMLRSQAPDAWKAAHGRLFEHFMGSGDDRDVAASVLRAVAHGCACGRHQDALDALYRARQERDLSRTRLRALGSWPEDLAAMTPFFEKPWSRPHRGVAPEDRPWLLGEVGGALRALVRLDMADRAFASAMEEALTLGLWRYVAAAAANLSALRMTRGNLAGGFLDGDRVHGAFALAKQAVEYSDVSNDGVQQLVNRTVLADALHQLGRLSEAWLVFAEAERMQATQQEDMPRLYSVPGYKYGQLLLSHRPAKARKRADELLLWSRERGGSWLDIALAHLQRSMAILADPHADLGAARNEVDDAFANLRRSGRIDFMPIALLTRAALRRRLGDFEGTAIDLTEARAIATRGDMRLHLVDADLEAARLALARGDRRAAVRYYAVARDGVRDIRYHRRDPELEELAYALDEAPPDWLHQADIEVDLPI